MDNYITIIVAVVSSVALFSFAQFLLTRWDRKKEIEKQIKQLDEKINSLEDKIDENAAILARTHILRFADELHNGMHHSLDYFRQQIQDCDTYEKYCNEHPTFSNGLTIMASKFIKETYEKELRTVRKENE